MDTFQRSGTGLGLALSRGLAEQMGGTIAVSSELGRGSTFVLRLPAETEGPQIRTLSTTPVTPEPRNAGSSSLSAHVLVAEDGPDNQVLLDYLLTRAGCRVSIVDNGADAVERAMATPFDVILMDVSMPVMDGDEATRILRDRGYAPLIVSLTAHALPDVRERCLAAGADAYLSKPFRRHELLALLRSLVSASSGA